jgi:succinyl-CoA synthetase beta subunit/malate-CoA ligase subunit beta
MDIHEYQAKEILSGFGVEVSAGALAYSPIGPANSAAKRGSLKPKSMPAGAARPAA